MHHDYFVGLTISGGCLRFSCGYFLCPVSTQHLYSFSLAPLLLFTSISSALLWYSSLTLTISLPSVTSVYLLCVFYRSVVLSLSYSIGPRRHTFHVYLPITASSGWLRAPVLETRMPLPLQRDALATTYLLVAVLASLFCLLFLALDIAESILLAAVFLVSIFSPLLPFSHRF